MSFGIDQAIEGAREQSRAARDGASGAAQLDSRPSSIRLGVVASVNGDAYTVEVLAADGTVADTLPGVRVWGQSVFQSDDKVALAWIGDRPIPVIIGGGGGGGGGSIVPIVAACLLANGE